MQTTAERSIFGSFWRRCGMGSMLQCGMVQYSCLSRNYCTYDKESLIQFSFDLVSYCVHQRPLRNDYTFFQCDVQQEQYDLDGSGEISVEEMTQILRELYGNKIDNSSYASRILGRIKDLAVQQGKGGQVSRDEFSQFTRTHPAMLFPAFQLQRQVLRVTPC